MPFGEIPGDALRRTVLIVEDNDLNMLLLRDLLEANGYRTVQAADGSEALTSARAYRPDLILLDIQLPRMSGFEVVRTLKTDPELKRIPVVAVTAFAMPGDEKAIRAAGCEDYVAKPISTGHLLRTVKRHIGLQLLKGGRVD